MPMNNLCYSQINHELSFQLFIPIHFLLFIPIHFFQTDIFYNLWFKRHNPAKAEIGRQVTCGRQVSNKGIFLISSNILNLGGLGHAHNSRISLLKAEIVKNGCSKKVDGYKS